jgi:hypothetical protein
MSDTAITVLIVAVAIVVVLFVLRERLGDFSMRANGKGIETRVKAHAPTAMPKTSIRRNLQCGSGNEIDAGDEAVVEENVQEGTEHKISARPTSRPIGKTR